MAESITLDGMGQTLAVACLDAKMGEPLANTPWHIKNLGAVSEIIVALVRVGCVTKDQALGLIGKHTPAEPFHKDGVWHCPTCNSRAKVWHSYCHQCGQRMNWGRFKK